MAYSEGGVRAASASTVTDGRYATTIRTPDQRLRVFVSSTLHELAPERLAVRRAITNLRLAPVLFELGARPHPPRDLYRAYLEQSHIFIGVYWQRYGWVAPNMEISGLEDEYRLCGDRPKLIYVRTPAPEREAGLEKLLEAIQLDDNASYKSFSSPDELQELVENDLALLLTERFERAAVEPSRQFGAVEEPHLDLPQPTTPLVGRGAEIEAVCRLLSSAEVRLVTLCGPGGIGKTRLGLAVAEALRERFADGVYFVPLAPIRDHHFVPNAIGQALGLNAAGTFPLLESLKGFLRSKQALLLLDNFEQVLDAAPLVAEVLAAARNVKVLVTSRSVLRLSSEHEFTVPPLELPERDLPISLDAVGESEAVTLFSKRARAVLPEFELTDDNAVAVTDICRRLDGLPLAIELAAARIKFLAPKTLLKRLDRRLELLTGGPRDLPDRQQTIRSTLDWSFRLLNREERLVFARLGLFVGGFSLEAAEALNDDVTGVEVVEVLFSLADKSLLKHQLSGDEPRFFMLETVREYAQERWRASEEAGLLRRKHAEYYLTLTERAANELRGHQQQQWLELLGREHPNLRAALRRSLADGEYRTVVRMGWNLWPYWWIRGHQNEGRRWLDEALERATDLSTSERAKAYFVAGAMAVVQGDYEEARGRAQACVDLSRASESPDSEEAYTEALGLLGLGLVALYSQDLPGATENFERSFAIFEGLDDWWGKAHVLHYLWRLAAFQGRAAEEIAKLQQSASLFRRHGDKSALVLILHNLAMVALAGGDHSQAGALLNEGMNYSLELRNKWYLAYCLEGFASLAVLQGNLADGGRVFGAAEGLRDLVHAPRSPADEALYQEYLTMLTEQQEEFPLAELWLEGRSWTLDQALERALEQLSGEALPGAA